MCLFCHRCLKRTFGAGQRMSMFVWGMRLTVIGLNMFPLYTMNYVSITLPYLQGNERMGPKRVRSLLLKSPLQLLRFHDNLVLLRCFLGGAPRIPSRKYFLPYPRSHKHLKINNSVSCANKSNPNALITAQCVNAVFLRWITTVHGSDLVSAITTSNRSSSSVSTRW